MKLFLLFIVLFRFVSKCFSLQKNSTRNRKCSKFFMLWKEVRWILYELEDPSSMGEPGANQMYPGIDQRDLIMIIHCYYLTVAIAIDQSDCVCKWSGPLLLNKTKDGITQENIVKKEEEKKSTMRNINITEWDFLEKKIMEPIFDLW